MPWAHRFFKAKETRQLFSHPLPEQLYEAIFIFWWKLIQHLRFTIP
jgi:hypothetical protein